MKPGVKVYSLVYFLYFDDIPESISNIFSQKHKISEKSTINLYKGETMLVVMAILVVGVHKQYTKANSDALV